MTGQTVIWRHSHRRDSTRSLWSLPAHLRGFNVSSSSRQIISHWPFLHCFPAGLESITVWHCRVHVLLALESDVLTGCKAERGRTEAAGLRSTSLLEEPWGHCPSPAWHQLPPASWDCTCPLTDASSEPSWWGRTPPGWPPAHTGLLEGWSPPAREPSPCAPLSASTQSVKPGVVQDSE